MNLNIENDNPFNDEVELAADPISFLQQGYDI